MAQTFKIQAVSQQVKDWSGKFGPMKDYKVKLEGTELPVTITRKPESAPPKAGDEIYGTLDMSGQYGPKFKSESKPDGFRGGSGGGSSGGKSPKDEKAIQAMWAIGQAINALGTVSTDGVQHYLGQVNEMADELFNMVDMVKTSTPNKDEVVTDIPDDMSDIFGDVEVIDTGDI